ncbi:hypothetical protein DPMN_015879 [Dreissena polymorpha]|uniref:Uncharacterized protein n=1 Tax=Dreissena polymorpha TaxID=45954 RepID=A0A9D4NBV0_DREPO|nr:hypothetical protein DPMN_015879 [Dreissena polymorpha]
MNTGKRTCSSTASETSSNTSLLETSVFEKSDLSAKNSSQAKNKTKSKPDSKKQKTMTTFVKNTQQDVRDSDITIEKRLDEISGKLSRVLTKDDSTFIKEMIKETVEQLKEKLLGNVLRRIEILESDSFEPKREIEMLKNENLTKTKQIEELQ